MKYGVERISPTLASELLKGNVGNRPLSKGHVLFLATQMKNKQWKLSGDPIRISPAGEIVDGQHRLEAVVQSGETIDFFVIRGIDKSVFDVIDTGRARSAADGLSVLNYDNTRNMSSIVRSIILYESGVYSAVAKENRNVSNQDILNYVTKNKDYCLELTKNALARYKDFNAIKATEYGLLQYIFDKISEDDAHTFLTKVSSGVDLSGFDPVLVLRNRLIHEYSSTAKLPKKWRLALFIRAWNNYRRGIPVSKSVHTTLGEFPTPI